MAAARFPGRFRPEQVGTTLGRSAAYAFSQAQIDRFAELTGDRQWLHTDPVRAAAGPYGAPVAHGYLILALIPALSAPVLALQERGTAINLGLDRVRFVRALRTGDRFYDHIVLGELTERPEGQRLSCEHTLRLAESGETLAVVTTVTLLIPAAGTESGPEHPPGGPPIPGNPGNSIRSAP